MNPRHLIKAILRLVSRKTPTSRLNPRTFRLNDRTNALDEGDIIRRWDVVSKNPKYEGKRIPDVDGVALYRLIRQFRPQTTMEVGYYSGASTIAICAGLRDCGQKANGQHVALDLEDWNGGPENVKEAGFENFVRFVTGDSALSLPPLVVEGLNVDFAFIDGNHRFDFCLIDFFYCDRLLKVGGIMAFHDAQTDWVAVNKVLAFVESNRAYEPMGRYAGLQIYKKLRADFHNGKFNRDARLFNDF